MTAFFIPKATKSASAVTLETRSRNRSSQRNYRNDDSSCGSGKPLKVMEAATSSYLTPTQRYAAGALFGLALHQSQLHQTHPLGLPADEPEPPTSSSSSSGSASSFTTDAVSEDPHLWAHPNSGLLRPVFKYLFSSVILFLAISF